MAPCGCSHLRSMNCPPTPPQTQQQPNYNKLGLMLGQMRGRSRSFNLPLYHEARRGLHVCFGIPSTETKARNNKARAITGKLSMEIVYLLLLKSVSYKLKGSEQERSLDSSAIFESVQKQLSTTSEHFQKWPKNQGIVLALSPPI